MAVDAKLLVNVVLQTILIAYQLARYLANNACCALESWKVCMFSFLSHVLFVACFRWQVYYSSNMEIHNFQEYPTRSLPTMSN